jgi:hypothetical protein
MYNGLVVANWLDNLVDGLLSDNDDYGDDNESSEGEDIVEVEDENVEPFTHCFQNDMDAEFDDALCFDRIESATFLVRPTQASYSKPDNWIERNRIGLEQVKIQLQNYIDSVSH